jgi:predicted secreted protein
LPPVIADTIEISQQGLQGNYTGNEHSDSSMKITTAWADILLPAKSAFPTSLWVMQEVELRLERQSRARMEQLPNSDVFMGLFTEKETST